MNYRIYNLMGCIVLLSACASKVPAPIVDGNPAIGPVVINEATSSLPSSNVIRSEGQVHTVKRGDNLFRLSRKYNTSIKSLINWNRLKSATNLRIGQQLIVAKGPASVRVRPVTDGNNTVTNPGRGQSLSQGPVIKNEPKAGTIVVLDQTVLASTTESTSGRPPAPPNKPAPPSSAQRMPAKFIWPTKGKLLDRFGVNGNKGVNISGKQGQPVLAAGAGKVNYVGSGLRGYGNLIIIRHTNGLLTAYAHNKMLHVKENQTVAAGQKIAEMGKSDADRVMLHFEVRLNGKPVDPLKYLPAAN